MQAKSFIITIEVIQRITTSAHNSVEFFKIKHSVSISVCFLKHFSEFFIRDLLSNFTGNTLEIFKANFIESIFIEQFENFVDFFF